MPKLSYRIEYQYNDERGILPPVALRYSGRETDFFARVDTGASFCIFQRLHAETVGIAVESGSPTRVSTVTGTFVAYAHLFRSSAFRYQRSTGSIQRNRHASRCGFGGSVVRWHFRIAL